MASNEREDMKTCRVCSSVDISNGNLKSRNYLCRSCSKKKCASWRLSNPKKVKSQARRYYDTNKSEVLEQQSGYRKYNLDKVNAKSSLRRATKLAQTPEMSKAELVEIESMYMYNHIMPGDWHVDHIQPLAAGGLHHPSNLQVLSKFDNLSKGAKWDT